MTQWCNQARRGFEICTLILVGCVLGCGGGGPKMPPTFPVSGTVSLDGKPLAEGSIVFDSTDGKTTASSGGIKDGKFEFRSTAGEKIVRINSPKVTDAKDEYGSQISVELVGQEFHRKSTLKATVKEGDNKDLKFEVRGPSGM